MADKKKHKSKRSDELIDIKSLLGNADGGGFTVDDILSEFGTPKISGPDLPWPESPGREPHGKNVVMFPGSPPPEEPAPFVPELQEVIREVPSPPVEPEPPLKDNVIEFPEEESALTSLLKDLKARANDYADQMFEESEQAAVDEIHRLEQLIPGTDQETMEPESKPKNSLFVRRPPKPEELPPDVPPQELAKRFRKQLKKIYPGSILLFFTAAAALLPIAAPFLNITWPAALADYRIQVLLSAALLGVGVLLSMNLLLDAAFRMTKGKIGMDTLALFAAVFTIADALTLSAAQNRQGQLPYCGVVLVSLFMLSRGNYHKLCASRLSCRTAAMTSNPYLVTLDDDKWNGKKAYSKWPGEPAGFGSQVLADDGAQRIYRVVCPLLLLSCILFSLLASVGQGKPQHLLWCLSATFTASSALGGSLCYGRPFHKIARRLSKIGGALAGWPGIARTERGNRILLSDGDLFPPGNVKINGFKVCSEAYVKHPETVLSCAATLIKASGSELGSVFHDELRKQGGLLRRAESLKRYEGGLSGVIRGSQVLVGSPSFMTLMEIPIPQGLGVKNRVLCAINGEITGVFVLEYKLPEPSYPAISSLIREKVIPVLATRDFNIIPSMLCQRFKLDADRMDFPPVERREELSDPSQPHSAILTAVLCREGVTPFAEAVAGAQRLRRCTRAGAVLCCLSSVIGILLCAYLTSMDAYISLSPQNLLIYLAAWLAPVWLLTDWAAGY